MTSKLRIGCLKATDIIEMKKKDKVRAAKMYETFKKLYTEEERARIGEMMNEMLDEEMK